MNIKFINYTKHYNIDEFREKIKLIFTLNKIIDEFNIIFISKPKIKEINNTFRKIDKTTDVLSFPDNDIENKNYIGDIFICLDIAKRQANKLKQSFAREVTFLSIHGYLHLKGYDHIKKIDEKKMVSKQDELMSLYK